MCQCVFLVRACVYACVCVHACVCVVCESDDTVTLLFFPSNYLNLMLFVPCICFFNARPSAHAEFI
eukprot:m.141051 g.141051  ORF g.141051 m.141051 type:complete len:66 (-) comp13191_c0_seq3:1010-1207(-)